MTGKRFDEGVDVAKLGRMHGVVLSVLDELRMLDLDPSSVARLEALTQQTLVEIGSAVPDELLAELGRVTGGAGVGDPTADELRVVEAQLLGWLRGMARASRFEDLQAVVAQTQDEVARIAQGPLAPGLTSGSGYL